MRSIIFYGWAVAFFVAGVIAALLKLVAAAGFFMAAAKFLATVGLAISVVRILFVILGGGAKDSG